MILTILIKEIQDHLFKLRFLLLGFVLVLLFVFASLAFIADYSKKVESFESPQQLLEEYLEDQLAYNAEMSKLYSNIEKEGISLFVFAQQ